MNSKKLILIICLFTSYTLYAQGFRAGLLFGLNASQVDGDTYAGYNKFGVAFGAYVYRPISNNLDIQLEIKYMGKGAAKKTSETDPYKYTNQLHYIEIPIVLRFNTSPKLALEGGIGYGYLFSNVIADSNNSQSVEGFFKTSDVLGLGGIKYAATKKLSVIMRFSYSFLNIKEGLGSYTNYKKGGAYNNNLSICLFYEFNSKNKS